MLNLFKVVLPVCENPPIKTYLHHAYPIGVILANAPYALPWIKSRFLQLYFDENNSSYKMDFYPPPFYDNECLDDGHIKEAVIKENMLDISRKLIDDGYYLTFIVDEYYIQEAKAFQKFHFGHWLMVHGFDENGFYCIGYLKNKKYSKFYLSSKVLETAVIKKHGIGVYKLHKDYTFKYDSVLAGELIYDFANGINTSEKNRIFKTPLRAKFGRDVYQCMIKDLENGFDYRYPHILIEHKENMLYNLQGEYCNEQRLLKKYESILHKCRYLEFLYLKQNLRYSKELTDEISILITIIDDEESKVLNSLLNKS